jgi:hypothetical protein
MHYLLHFTDVGEMDVFSVAWPPKYMKRTFAIAVESLCLGAELMHAPSDSTLCNVQALP